MLRALDKSSGKLRWDYDIRKDGDQRQFHGDPLVTEQLFIIGTDGNMGHVYAFNRTTGAVAWKYSVEQGGVVSDIVRLGQNAYAVTLSDELICLDLQTGKPRWTFHSTFADHDFHWTPPATLNGDRVYFGGQDGVLYALDAQSGKLIWKRILDGAVTTSMAIRGNDLYLGTEHRHIYRIDSKSGDLIADFRSEWRPRWNLVSTENSLIMFLGDEIIASLDLSLKKMQWSAEASKEWTSARPYLWRGLILAGNRRELLAFRSADGLRQWSHDFPEVVRGIGTSDDVLYVGSLKGPVFAYTPKP
jgi:outer membrane protein assembly factor BamB